MTKTSPLVSIVVPAYNAERFLGDALASVCAQSHSAIEVIVCDDCLDGRDARDCPGTGDVAYGICATIRRSAGTAR